MAHCHAAFLSYNTGAIDNVFKAGLDGMLGLGFDDGSNVKTTVQRNTGDDSGRTLLSNFFVDNPEQPHTMSFVMSRLNDGTDDDGLFMIGEPEPQYAAVATAPANPVHVNSAANDFQRWSIYLDAIEINGVNITGMQSIVKGAPAGKLVANMDTGTSLGWLPAAAVDAIYKNVDGAVYFAETDQYTVPCLTEFRLAFWFNGVRFPIHPLDVTRVQQAATADASGNRPYLCTNAFIHTAALASQTATLDLQLGDSFLRNVIAQYDFGDLANPQSANVRMVSTVPDELAAMNDFLQVRAKQVGVAAPAPVTELPGGAIPTGSPSTSSATSTGSTLTVDPTNAPAPTAAPGTDDNGTPSNGSTDGSSTDSGAAPETNDQSGTGSASALAPRLSVAVFVLLSVALCLL